MYPKKRQAEWMKLAFSVKMINLFGLFGGEMLSDSFLFW